MKRLLKVLGWIFFTVGLIYAGGGLVLLQITGQKLLTELEELKKAGHLVTVAQAHPKPAETENAAPIYDVTLKKLEKVSADDLKKLQEFVSKPAPGNAEVLAILTQHKSAIDELASAETRMRCWFGDLFQAPLPKFTLALDVLSARCLYASLNGQPEAALKDFRTILHIAHCARQGPIVVEAMVADSVLRTAGHLLPKLNAATSEWKALLPLLDPSGFEAKVKRALGVELVAGIAALTGAIPMGGPEPSIGRRVLFPLRNQMALAYLGYWKEASRLMKEPYPKSKAALAELTRTAEAEPLLPQYSPIVALSFDKLADALVLTQARLHLLRLAVEILASDTPPTKLAEINAYTGETWKLVTNEGLWIDGGAKLKLRIR